MFHEERSSVPETPEQLLEEYLDHLASIVDSFGLESTTSRIDVDRPTLVTLSAGEKPSLTFEEAAQIAALSADDLDPTEVETIACEHLLLAMSMAILDVEAVAASLDLDLDAKEIQQKIERRAPMTLAEFAHVQHAVVRRLP